MKFTLCIDSSRDEEVTVYAHRESSLTEAIARLCADDELLLVGTSERGTRRITPSEVCCFTVERDRLYAVTEDERLMLKCRLYTLEKTLSEGFLKLNQSCLANIAKIERFDASLSGTLAVYFAGGHRDFVSRRNLKNVKERLGLK